MIIWFAANIDKNSFGGVSRSMHELAASLRQKGHHTEVIYRPAWMPDNYLLFALYLLVRLLVKFLQRPHWIVARSCDALLCSGATRIFKLGTRIALHNHGWEERAFEFEKRLPKNLVTSPTTWKARLIRFPLLRLALFMCHCCICGTICEIRWLRRKYPKLRACFAYVPNGVHPQATPYWTTQHQIPLNFLCIGAPTWKKNLQHSIAVFAVIQKQLPQAKLFLVGTGWCLRDTISAEGLCPNKTVSIVESVPLEKMNLWYTKCPYLIASSRFEGGHSLAILEAMSYAAMVFVSKLDSTLEFVCDTRNGVVISGHDVAADAQRILAVLGDLSLCESIRINAYQTSLRHCWKRQAARLEAALSPPNVKNVLLSIPQSLCF